MRDIAFSSLRFNLPFRRKRGDFSAASVIWKHLDGLKIDDLSISERIFPMRVRPDIQRAMEDVLKQSNSTSRFHGLRSQMAAMRGMQFADLLTSRASDATIAPPHYEEVDIGEDHPAKCLSLGLWLLQQGDIRIAILQSEATNFGQSKGISFQVAAPSGSASAALVERFFSDLESAVRNGRSYRGKILSLEQQNDYSGKSGGVKVHKLRSVSRDQVILPAKTLALLERNVIGFVQKRKQLASARQSAKKGILFYGPPGTGKTHTIHYLAGALPGHTTFLITAEQVGLLDEYMSLARLLHPSIVVIEDADLIARDRAQMNSPCEEVMLNKLLNEMDGLREDSEILFILTTNRPEQLETALSSRPGRVDQAIEFPVPDDEGRRKLVKLYKGDADLSPPVLDEIVSRTPGVSAAFIKELMRRSSQIHLERDTTPKIELPDVDAALDEMLFSGGSLNLKLLGGKSNDTNG